MGCGSSAARVAPSPEPSESGNDGAPPESTDDPVEPVYINTDDQLMITTDTSPLILTDKSFMQSSIMSLECLTVTDCPSFFNPIEKPCILEYQFQHHIGHGSASDVFLVINTENNIQYAAKVYDPNYLYQKKIGTANQPIEKVYNEIKLMSMCRHPNIVSLIEVLDDQPTNSLVLIIPYAEKGSLSKSSWSAERLDENAAKNIFRQIASGLDYLHSMNIIHRDLKPENVLCFEDGHVGISDFSVSKLLEDPSEFLSDTEGTPVFYSPEICSGEPYQGKPADIWAFGIILYLIIYGKLPFFEPNDENALKTHFFHISQVISNNEIVYPDTIKISAELRDLFNHILQRDPQKRYDSHQILSHPWFNYDE